MINKVAEFHKEFNQKGDGSETLKFINDYQLRHKLMSEENDEYLQACKDGNIVEVADALGDQLYILFGTILKHGLQHKIEEVFNEIHRSNMSKKGGGFRYDGKILKGKDYFKPHIESILFKKD